MKLMTFSVTTDQIADQFANESDYIQAILLKRLFRDLDSYDLMRISQHLYGDVVPQLRALLKYVEDSE